MTRLLGLGLVPALHSRCPEGQPANRRAAQSYRSPEECDACSDRARMAPRPEAVDRSDPGHTKAEAFGRKPWSSGNRTDFRRPPMR
jgi:hypothetical protein